MRTNNARMIRVLLDLGFDRVGKPYPRRDQELAVFLRSPDGESMATERRAVTDED